MLRKCMFCLSVCTTICTTTAGAKEPLSTLTINGAATLKKPADQLYLSVAVLTEADNAEAALENNNLKMQGVIAAIQAEELTQKEYSTGQFNIAPVYAPYPKNRNPDWTQKINGYRVTNALSIQTDKLERAGKIIDAVTQAGANSIDHIAFGLKDLRLYRQEAIKAATLYAMQDAKDLAESANMKLGQIHQIWLDHANGPEPQLKAFSASNLHSSTPLEPGDVAVNANVTIVFELLAK